MDETLKLPYETKEILFYKTSNGDVKVEILLYDENLWLTQGKMAELFDVQKPAVSKHLKNIFATDELSEDSVVSILETTAADGKNYLTRYYNLDQKSRIRKPDVSIAKNYLNEEEIANLNEIVTMYLDYVERQAKRGNIMYMADWVEKLNAFLRFNEEDVLQNKGKVTAEIAKSFAEGEFEKYRVLRDASYQSDFDALLAETEDLKQSQ